MLQETLVDLCPSCGERTDANAAECRSCGASLVLWAEKSRSSSSGTRKGRRRSSSDSFWPPEGPLPVQEALDYAPGELFAGRYVVIDRLGQGGMGVVYKARDRETNRTVALKMIRGSLEGDQEALSRFRREPGLAQQVTHENVCRVHDLGIMDGVRYLSMEYLEAETLARLIQSLGSLSVKQTLQIALQVASGLEAIHEQGIVHRDLKPSNIAVASDGRVVVMDFGLARGPFDSSVTEPGVLVGSYAYLAPEHIRGEPLTGSADVYALGLVLYEMLTGSRPPGDEDQRPLALRGEEAVLPSPSSCAPDVAKELDAVILRCLSWSVSDRPTISEIRESLRELLVDEEARVVPLRREVKPSSSRRKKTLAAFGALLLGASALAAALWPGPSGPTGIALVPFDVEKDVPGSESLSAFTADGLSAVLQTAPGIRVSVVEEDLRAKPDADILRALSAQWLLRGSVSSEGGVTAFHAVLSRANGRVVLRETVEGSEPIDALEQVSRQVLKALSVSTDVPGIASRRTSSIEAYRNYLEARSHHDGWFAEGDVEKARSLYQQALKLDPSFAAALAGQALASASRFLSTREPGDMAVARYASERALALGDRLPEAQIARATVLAAEEKWDEARAAFARGFELAPGDYGARRNAADLYETLGRSDEAQAIYERIVADEPLHWVNHYWYGGFLYREGNLKAAAVYLERARELAPDAHAPVTLLGFCHLASGDLDRARSEFERALALSPEPRARKRLGLVHYYAGSFDRARELWSQVLAAEPETPAAHTDVGDALRLLGRTSEARSHYQTALDLYAKAIALTPEDELFAQRAHVLAAIGRCSEARREMQPLLERHPGNPDFLHYGTLTAARCHFDDWASQLVLESIAVGSVVGIWFDPDLARVRLDPRVRRPLELIGTPE